MLSARYQLLCVILLFTYFFRQYVESEVIDPILIKGSKFFYQNNGSQFFIKGVIYQRSRITDQRTIALNLALNAILHLNPLTDPLTNSNNCSRDVPYLKDLHANVVRTYYIDPSQDHSNCMALFAQAGIYVMVDLMAPGYILSTENPVWNDVLYKQYTSVIDTMHNYTNLLGFILGDDVIGDITQNHLGPYLKAAVRDMKAYIRQKGYRPIPVGSVNSVNEWDKEGWINPTNSQDKFTQDNFTFSDYLNCGDKSDDNIDFWGANIRSWCRGIRPNYTYSSYANATSALFAYPVPGFLAAYGCINPSELDFSDIDIIYGQLMSPVWSGGIFYQYFGLVDQEGVPVGAYENVSRHLATVSPSSINSENYIIPINTAAPCPEGAALSLPPNPMAVRSTTSSLALKTSNNALSTGGKVGIGIGSALLVLALVLGTFFIQRRAMERKSIDRDSWTKSELPAVDVDREAQGYGPHIAASTQRAEVDGSEVMCKVQADSSEIVEAPGDFPTLPELSGRHGEENL